MRMALVIHMWKTTEEQTGVRPSRRLSPSVCHGRVLWARATTREWIMDGVGGGKGRRTVGESSELASLSTVNLLLQLFRQFRLQARPLGPRLRQGWFGCSNCGLRVQLCLLACLEGPFILLLWLLPLKVILKERRNWPKKARHWWRWSDEFFFKEMIRWLDHEQSVEPCGNTNNTPIYNTERCRHLKQ